MGKGKGKAAPAAALDEEPGNPAPSCPTHGTAEVEDPLNSFGLCCLLEGNSAVLDGSSSLHVANCSKTATSRQCFKSCSVDSKTGKRGTGTSRHLNALIPEDPLGKSQVCKPGSPASDSRLLRPVKLGFPASGTSLFFPSQVSKPGSPASDSRLLRPAQVCKPGSPASDRGAGSLKSAGRLQFQPGITR